MSKPDAPAEIEIPTKWIVIAVAVAFCILLLWTIIATRQRTKIAAQLKATQSRVESLQTENQDLKNQHEDIVRGRITAYYEQQLQKLYPGITKLAHGKNDVDRGYVASLEVSDLIVRVALRNTDDSALNPNLDISFFTDEGILTQKTTIGPWILDRIKPGETRVVEKGLLTRWDPTYYQIAFR